MDERRRAPGPQALDAAWHPVWGDRRQELVFIGVDMAREELTSDLDACLLTEEEMAAGPSGWSRFNDPFPTWEEAEELESELETSQTTRLA
ncbi:GTP-binding protein [Sorangium sp. So ce1128]